MYTLPVGYTTAVVAGTTYYLHEGQYFKPSYAADDVVYVAVEDPKEAAASEADAQAQPASTGSVEQELSELKSLYDKGLIDEDDYENKKKEILDSM